MSKKGFDIYVMLQDSKGKFDNYVTDAVKSQID